jgi:hypothetical protein
MRMDLHRVWRHRFEEDCKRVLERPKGILSGIGDFFGFFSFGSCPGQTNHENGFGDRRGRRRFMGLHKGCSMR